MCCDFNTLTVTQARQANSNCPFFALPPEIRNAIYTFACVHTGYININFPEQPLKLPDILCVCRQMRRECLPIYLGENRFTIWDAWWEPGDDEYVDSTLWLDALGPSSKLVRKLNFETLVWESTTAAGEGDGVPYSADFDVDFASDCA